MGKVTLDTIYEELKKLNRRINIFRGPHREDHIERIAESEAYGRRDR